MTTLALVGCHAGPSPRAAQPSADPGPSDPHGWSAQSWEERHDTMTFVVLPNMARAFQAHDRAPYPTMTCATCHGANGEARQYKMPNDLAPLDPKNMPNGQMEPPARAETVRFMTDVVTPAASDLMDTKATCFTCHPAVKS